MKDKESNGRPTNDREILVGYREIVSTAAVEWQFIVWPDFDQ